MSWIDGPCNDGPDEAFIPEPESNVVRESDDEQPEPRAWGGATHFHPYLVNQRWYPDRSRGSVRDAG